MSAVLVEKTTFEKGMSVEWVCPEGMLQSTYGKGPFQVVKVCEVPIERCDCGGGHFNATFEVQGHARNCPKYNELSVGHHQWVVVLVDGVEKRFTGAYFKPATTSEVS